MASQWDDFPDAPVADQDWSQFEDAPRSVQKTAKRRTLSVRKAPAAGSILSAPTGENHDGDTFRLKSGDNARLYGVDAFELDQQGRRNGQPVALGHMAKDYLGQNLGPDGVVTATGWMTYNRPVVALSSGGRDAAQGVLSSGLGMATPEYLKNDPDRLLEYMEAERGARLNRRGAFAGQAQYPKDFRAGKADPWAKAEEGQYGNSIAVFPDEPTPFQGLRPEVEQGYMALAKDRNSTAADLLAYAKANGFQIDPKVVERFIAERNKGRDVADGVTYEALPPVLTNQGDGALGAGVRGLADPINMLDEIGGVIDTVGLTPGRENIWDSDRRFGDILYNNIDQNRGVLAYDDAEHPYARFAGQLASGLVLPGASVEGVGAAAARGVLLNGGSRFAAAQAAKSAVRRRLAVAGAAEGSLAGFGGAEGGVVDRLPSAGVGGVAGTVLGVGGAELLNAVAPAGRAVINKVRGRVEEAAPDVMPSPASRDWDAFADAPQDIVEAADQASNAASTTESARLADEWSAMEAGKARYQRSIADLWRQTPEELEALHSRALAKERVDLMDAATRSGMELSPELRRTIEKGSIERAGARLADALDKHFGGNVPDDIDRLVNPRWADHQDGGLPNSDDVDEVLKAYGLIIPTDDDHSIASEMGWALRKLNTGDLEAVARGEGGAPQQAAMATVREGYRILGDRGVNKDSVPPMIAEAMVRNGVPPHLANELTGQLFDMLRQAAGPRSEMSGAGAALPGAASSGSAGGRADMLNETTMPSISSPRIIDRIDVNDRARPMLDAATDMARMQQAERVNPADVLPIPSNEVASLDEAAAISAGRYPAVKAPNEMDELGRRDLPSPVDATRTLPKRGPLDLNTFLRTKGGLIDKGGELRHMGVTNAGRDLDFAKGEQRFGKLVDNENGMTLDDAADLAWREGYFPDYAERPTVAEFLDAVDNTNRGINRSFRPDDLAEVDAFAVARDQRLAVERARDEGAPLVEDRGQPVTMDDLEANQPPVTAYEEWGENAPDFAGNIRLSKLESPQDIKRALTMTNQRVGSFDAATRGRIAQAETEQLASEIGMTARQLLSRRAGQAFNAEQALAARQILAKSGNELVNMARAIQRLDDPGEEKLAAFRQAWVRHVAIQEQIAGITAEAGRTLAQFRMVADGRNVRGNILNALSEGGGGKERLKAAADLILENADSPGDMNKMAAKALKPKFLDQINEFWINSLLSGPATHVVNAVSNTMTALAQIPEHAVAAGIGGARQLALQKHRTDRVLFSELGARTVGLLQGTREGLAQAARTWRTGEGSDFAGKVEARTQDAIPGKVGNVIRTPTRLLNASDELFKGMARRMELSGLAVRKAASEGLTGEEAKARAAELLANPTEEMLDRAFDYGRYLTFQRPLGEGMQHISRGIQKIPGFKFIVPFVRTPTNLLKFAVERSPAAPILTEWRRDVAAGGERRDLAVARMLVGTGVGAVAAKMAANGLITGNGPADEQAAALLRADGWQPYSIKIGDKYVSYSRLDPFATTLGVAAGLVELQDHMTEKQQDEVAALLTASIVQNLSSKTWLSGMSGVIEAINDPTRYADSFLQRLGSSFAVPAGVAQLARTVDPTMREAESVLDAVRARVPGLSKTLEPRRDIWGQPIVMEGGLGPDIVSPVRQSTRENDPVTKALLDAGVHISKPPEKDDMTAREYGQFHELSGSIAKDQIGELVTTPEWKGMDREDKQHEVFTILKAARKEAKSILADGGKADDPWAAFPDAPK
ncbi:thermonuclease family protein [Sphingobium phenoxybenzoativorans]|uniref:thermonuclease family protein n=1 Tax=Sphingobium phenoxybenzoativorans TaxID=1592790 RepID=UPI0008724C42|nr:hypothetical protein [Sphingobium phenoxybenzoativorans]